MPPVLLLVAAAPVPPVPESGGKDAANERKCSSRRALTLSGKVKSGKGDSEEEEDDDVGGLKSRANCRSVSLVDILLACRTATPQSYLWQSSVVKRDPHLRRDGTRSRAIRARGVTARRD